MALTLAEFKLRYPEFAQADTELDAWITAGLAQAEYLVADTWGDERDEILGLTTAANLARSPFGRHAQLMAKTGESLYSQELARRKRRHACALLRVG